jgi:hypothetical protein
VLAEVDTGEHLPDELDAYFLDLGVALICCHGDRLPSLVRLALFAFTGWGRTRLSTGTGAQGGGPRSSDRCGIARRATARSAACAARSVWPGFIARRARPGLEFAKPHPVGETQPPARALRPEGREADRRRLPNR